MTKVFIVSETVEQNAQANPALASAIHIATGEGFISRVQAQMDSSEDQAVFIRSDLSKQNATQIAALLKTLDASTTFAYVPLKSKNGIIEIVPIESSQILSFLISEAPLPSGSFILSRDLLSEISSAQSLNELFLKAATIAQAHSPAAEKTSISFAITEEAPYIPTKSERAQALRALVENWNIEDLFSDLPWASQQPEAAASAYQMLAAHFLQLRDFSAAKECLECSDRFEDSPRALALRGMIAKDTGEMLGAVANMVSSLQQYELRKHSYEIPKQRSTELSIEVINSSLVEGLEALNRRDNEKALQCFTEAVFTFDPFYKEFGLDR